MVAKVLLLNSLETGSENFQKFLQVYSTCVSQMLEEIKKTQPLINYRLFPKSKHFDIIFFPKSRNHICQLN